MTDAQRKEAIKRQRAKIDALEGIIVNLRAENSMLKQQIAELNAEPKSAAPHVNPT